MATEQKQEELSKLAKGAILIANGLHLKNIVFTLKYVKVVRQFGEQELNHNQVEAVKMLGGFYWPKVDAWVIPRPPSEQTA
jgi:hypothetical protein